MKVADVMQKKVAFVTTDTSVEDVVRLIFGMGINGVPVCSKKKVVGFITERDILSRFYPDSTEHLKKSISAADFERLEEKTSQIFKLSANDIMSKNPVTVQPDRPLLRAQSLMFIHKVGRLPVVDKKGSLLGIFSKGDIFKALIGERLALEEIEEYNDWLSEHQLVNIHWSKRQQYEIPDLIRLFEENQCNSILDIGCGTGEHSFALAENVFSVYGIERSKFMYDKATKKRSKLSNDIKKRVTFLLGESEQVLRNLKRKFDAAIFMGTALSFNPHNWRAVIKETSNKLNDSGLMVFQTRNIERVLSSQKRTAGITYDIDPHSHTKRMFFEYYDNPKIEEEIINKNSVIFDFDGKKWVFQGLKDAPLAYITGQKLQQELKKIGFGNIKTYGSYGHWDYMLRAPFDPMESDWLNIVAKR